MRASGGGADSRRGSSLYTVRAVLNSGTARVTGGRGTGRAVAGVADVVVRDDGDAVSAGVGGLPGRLQHGDSDCGVHLDSGVERPLGRDDSLPGAYDRSV